MTNGLTLTLKLHAFLNSFDDDDPPAESCGVYIFQLIRFGRVFSHVSNFNNQDKKISL